MIRTRSLAAILILLSACGTAAYGQRPTYPAGTERTLEVNPPGVDPAAQPGHCFRIHFASRGPAAPAATDDAPRNGIPDYVDDLAAVLAEVYTREIVQLGWPAPPSDATSRLPNGGDGRYDIYVDLVGGNIGFVQAEAAVAPGSNAAISFMAIDVDVKARYDEVRVGPGDIRNLTRRQAIQDVVAHEYFHSIQNGFNSGLFGRGLGNVKEATANWMNDEAYDDLNVNVRSEALGDFTLFRRPDVGLDAIPYGGWFWYRYLAERHGAAAIRDLWNRVGAVPAASTGPDTPIAATAAALLARGSSLREAWTDFAGKLDAKAWFEEGASWPEVRDRGLEASFGAYPVTGSDRDLNHVARGYVRLEPPTGAARSRTLQISVDGPAARDCGGVAVVETADGRRHDRRIALDAGGDGTITVGGFAAAGGPPHLRATSVVVALDNATQRDDGQPFGLSADLISGPDAAITPWGQDRGYQAPLWQSPDIWVDNDGDGVPNEPGEPSKGRRNTLIARVQNLGDAEARQVRVRFLYAPFGMGLPPAAFAEIGRRDVDLAAAGAPGGGDSRTVSIDWDLSDLAFNNGGRWDVPGTPAVETIDAFDHFCVRVVLELAPDVVPGNNEAQTNFAQVGATGRLRTNVLLANPLPSEAVGRLVVSPPLPQGWRVALPGPGGGGEVTLPPAAISLATIEVTGPADSRPDADLVADVSLVVRGDRVGGVSLLLARGPARAPAGPLASADAPDAAAKADARYNAHDGAAAATRPDDRIRAIEERLERIEALLRELAADRTGRGGR